MKPMVVIIALVTIFTVACTVPDKEYGWLVAGAGLEEFGPEKGDTLREFSFDVAPVPLQTSVQEMADELEYDSECTRYFKGDTLSVLLLRPSCRRGEVVEDGEVLVVFDRDGQMLGEPIGWVTPHMITDIFPNR